MLKWLSDNAGLLGWAGGALTGAAAFVAWMVAAIKREGDLRYERKRPTRTPEEQQLRIESLARQILSGPIIKEFADNTVLRAYERPEFRASVEDTFDTSMRFQARVDARIEHKAIDENLKQDIRFEKFRNEIGAEIRGAVAGSQTAIFNKIDILFEKLGELQSIQMNANK